VTCVSAQLACSPPRGANRGHRGGLRSLKGRWQRLTACTRHTNKQSMQSGEAESRGSVSFSPILPGSPIAVLSYVDEADEIVELRFGSSRLYTHQLAYQTGPEAMFWSGGGSFSRLASDAIDPARRAQPSTNVEGGLCGMSFTPRQWEGLRRLWQGKQHQAARL